MHSGTKHKRFYKPIILKATRSRTDKRKFKNTTTSLIGQIFQAGIKLYE